VLKIETLGENADFISIATQILQLSSIPQSTLSQEQRDFLKRTLNLVADMIGNVLIAKLKLEISSISAVMMPLTNFKTKIKEVFDILTSKSQNTNAVNSTTSVHNANNFMNLVTAVIAKLLLGGK
jgi:hypothetical protein